MKIINHFKNLLTRIFNHFYITNSKATLVFSQTRDISATKTRDIKQPQKPLSISPTITECPYCGSKNIVLRGKRKTKYELRQLYLCKDCKRSFTSQKVKGKQYPLNVVLEGISLYNIDFTLEETCKLLKSKFGLDVSINTLSNWVKEFEPICRYSRMREKGNSQYLVAGGW